MQDRTKRDRQREDDDAPDAERRVVDLMTALEESVLRAKARRGPDR